MAMVAEKTDNAPANARMGAAPTTDPHSPGEMLKPTLPEGILPIYLAKLFPKAAAAAFQAGDAEVSARRPDVRDIANVDLPREAPADAPDHEARREPHRESSKA